MVSEVPSWVYEKVLLHFQSLNSDADVKLRVRQDFPDSAIATDSDVDNAIALYHENLARIFAGRPDGAVVDPLIGPVVLPIDNRYWNLVKDNLRNSGRADQIESLESLTAFINSQLLAPSHVPQKTSSPRKGLVLGSVQSGKTTNFISLMARAFDIGYKLVIVLSGTTNILRSQTQNAADKLFGNSATHHPQITRLTGERDFAASRLQGNTFANFAASENVGYAVVKKNSSVLQSLLKWLTTRDGAGTNFDAVPILVIDDEADQASIQGGPAYRNKIAAINERLRALVSDQVSTRMTFVGYTATPFANLLLDPSDLKDFFPRHFIVSLPTGKGYFGAEQLFGREPVDSDSEEENGLDIIRDIPSTDRQILGKAVNSNSPNEGSATPELRKAITWFLLASTLKDERDDVKEPWTSMLINTSARINSHEAAKNLVKHELKSIREEVASNDISDLALQWNEELEISKAIRDNFAARPVETQELKHAAFKSRLLETIDRTSLIVDNSTSDERLDYENASPHPVIAIGGSTLSRGIVLRGLISTYFLRASNGYDSLFQMGRWFGYRSGYEDLQRIWMEPDVASMFKFLALVDFEIRESIAAITPESGRTPLDVPPLIRADPRMKIVARGHSGVRYQVGFADSRVETNLIEPGNDVKALNNLEQFRRLALEAQESADCVRQHKRTTIYEGVPWPAVAQLLSEFQFASPINDDLGSQLTEYVEKVRELSTKAGDAMELDKWNVYLFSRTQPHLGDFELTPVVSASSVKRTMGGSPPDSSLGYFKHIAGSKDFTLGFPSEFEQKVDALKHSSGGGTRREWNLLKREAGIEKRGILGLYFVSPGSEFKVLGENPDWSGCTGIPSLSFSFPPTQFSSATAVYVGPPNLVTEESDSDEDVDFDNDETD